MFATKKCATDGCDKKANVLTSNCRFHNVIEEARWLTAVEFDLMRETLATTAPVTQDERNASRARAALQSVEWEARDLKRARSRAIAAGATKGQVADAVKRGKAGA